jgi:hypothetical protein
MFSRLIRWPVTWGAVIVLAAGATFGLYWFQPWTLVVNERVDDALSTPVSPVPGETSDAERGASPTPAVAGPVVVAAGDFVAHKHATSGTARIIRNSDGSHQLELVELNTSNGPDLKVWLSDQPVIEGEDGWHVFGEGTWLDLGALKGNQGNQVYDLPAGADPGDYISVTIWCERFPVSFGAAGLR